MEETAKRPHGTTLVICSSAGHALGDSGRAVEVHARYLRPISDPLIDNPYQIDPGGPCLVWFNRRDSCHESHHAKLLSNTPLGHQ